MRDTFGCGSKKSAGWIIFHQTEKKYDHSAEDSYLSRSFFFLSLALALAYSDNLCMSVWPLFRPSTTSAAASHCAAVGQRAFRMNELSVHLNFQLRARPQ